MDYLKTYPPFRIAVFLAWAFLFSIPAHADSPSSPAQINTTREDSTPELLLSFGLPATLGQGARMANTALSSETIQTLIRKNYSIGAILDIQFIQGGIGSSRTGMDPCLITTNQGQFVFKRLFSVERLDKARYAISFMRHLTNKGLPVPRLIETQSHDPLEMQSSDRFMLIQENNIYTLEKYIEEGRVLQKEEVTHEHLKSIGELAANIQIVTRDFVPEGYSRWKNRGEILLSMDINKFEELKAKLNQKPASDVSLNASESYFLQEADSIKTAFELQLGIFLKTYTPELQQSFEEGHIHNDLALKNIKFDEKGNIVALFDFEMAQIDYSIVEFNNIILSSRKMNEGSFFDEEALRITFEAYEKKIKSLRRISDSEKIALWEILRSRIIENVYNDLFGTGSTALDANHYDRLKQNVQMLYEFPQQWIMQSNPAARLSKSTPPRPAKVSYRSQNVIEAMRFWV